MDDVTRLLSDLVAIPSVNPMGGALTGPEVLETRHERLPGGLVPAARDPRRAAAGLARARQPARPVRVARVAADGPLRRPSGHGADRRHDDRPVRRRGSTGGGSTAGARATSRGAWRRCSSPSPGSAASGPTGSASVVLACTVDEEFTHTGSSPGWPRPSTGPTWRSSPSRRCWTSSTATRARCAGRSGRGGRLPQLDAAPRRQRDLPDGPRSSRPWPSMPATSPHSTPDPILGPPSLSVGRIEGGQSVNVVPDWCEIEIDRRRDPGRGPARLPRARPGVPRRAAGRAWTGSSSAALGQHARRSSPKLGDWAWTAVTEAVTRRRAGRRQIVGVPYGTDAGPLGASGRAVRRLRSRRHRPGPHEG